MQQAPLRRPHAPEILAPAGDEECLKAAVGAGADAVYFGLSVGFNARAKAKGFTPEDLPRVLGWLHERGVKGYVTFNTLVFDRELDAAERCLTLCARAGVDALIVQDLGVARLAHALAPTMPLHASTQMTVSSPEAARVAKELGICRVILPRELSIQEMRAYAAKTDLELECFVHGALCVSYSGQCLTSEAWGQRSANRGQCAQSCRLPYDLLVDGALRSTGLEKYLLSPKDLAALDVVPELCALGISSLKIEGRYKGPDYVAAAVEAYRAAVDAVGAGKPVVVSPEQIETLSLTYSRGFTPGWMNGVDHQELSHGLYPGHRGLRVGEVVDVGTFAVWVQRDPGAPQVKAGDWMLFDQNDPEGEEPQGGVFAVAETNRGLLEVRFGQPGPDLTRVKAGDILRKSHDSKLKRRLLRYVDAERKIPLDLMVRGEEGAPLSVAAVDAWGRTASTESEAPLVAANKRGLDDTVLRSKLGAFGQTRFELRHLDVQLRGAVAVSPKELKQMRRRLIELLEQQPPGPTGWSVHSVDRRAITPRATPGEVAATQPSIVPLCRTLEQVEAALQWGAPEIILDFMEMVGLKSAVDRCRAAGARVIIATMRIQKPGEEPIDRRFERLAPDGILARHLGALQYFRHQVGPGFTLHGDFSLNAANTLSAQLLFAFGLSTLTPSYDLNVDQLEDLATALPPQRLEITVHQHLPLYHTEYCLYAHHLSEGRSYRDCGRPCEAHRVALRHGKLEHPVLVDVGCRNTVFNAKAQSAAQHVARLVELGVKRFRVELVWESAAETRQVLQSYASLLQGECSATEVARKLGGIERYGVTSGTLAVLA